MHSAVLQVVDVPGPWLNALDLTSTDHLEREKDPHRNIKHRRMPSIRERLVLAGIQLRKKVAIRVAPLKSSKLSFDYLNSQIKNMEGWVANLKSLHPNLVLPEIDKVKLIGKTLVALIVLECYESTLKQILA